MELSALDRACVALATGLGISFLAPPWFGRKWTGAGFLGTVEGAGLWFLLPRSALLYAVVVAGACAAACWICGRADRALGTHDNPRIVLDEIVGYWIAAAGLPRAAGPALWAFAAFRVFDSLKLPPYNRLERLPGGLGVVADDLGAGVAANLLARVLLRNWGWA